MLFPPLTKTPPANVNAKTAAILVLTTLLCTFSTCVVNAHTRWECPPPRTGETGEKTGPCDALEDDLSLEAFPLIPNALNTITWLESISHPGAPGRIALSLEGDDSANSFESCILLDHIPHDENSLPNFAAPSTYHRASITLWIPDIYCERCHLQLITVMSDDGHGVPEDTSCVYGGAVEAGTVEDTGLPACPVVYHSCAPVSINGTIPRDEFTCDTPEFYDQLEWPFTVSPAVAETETENDDDSQLLYSPSTYYYKGNPGMYDQSTAQLQAGGAPIQGCTNMLYCDPQEFFELTIPVADDAPYRQLQGACAAMVDKQVINFELGVLPSEPRNNTAQKEDTDCSPCQFLELCYATGGCAYRDTDTGLWSGPAESCNQGDPACEACYSLSQCYRGENSTTVPTDADADTDTNTMTGEEDSSLPTANDATSKADTVSKQNGWFLPFLVLIVSHFM